MEIRYLIIFIRGTSGIQHRCSRDLFRRSKHNQSIHLPSELLLSALEEKGIVKERKPEKSFGVPVKAEMPKEISKFAGIYGGNNSVTKIKINKAGQMMVSSLTAPSNPVQEYTYTADDIFVNERRYRKVEIRCGEKWEYLPVVSIVDIRSRTRAGGSLEYLRCGEA